MDNALIQEICNILNITYKKHKYFTDGVYSKVMLINDKYLVKQSNELALKSEVLYLDTYKMDLMQKIIYVDSDYRYVVYDFIDGEVMHEIENAKDTINKLCYVVSHYIPTTLKGYGYMDEPKDTWEDFLKDEIKDNNDLNNYVDDIKVNIAIKNLNKYSFNKSLIHGDFGTHNFIKKDGSLIGIIDPMTILGDPLYDLLFAIVSNIDILSTLTLDDIYNLSSDSNDKIKNLLVVVLYARMIRCLKYHREDIDVYLDFYSRIIL